MFELRKMDSAEFSNYMNSAVINYAAEKQKAEGLTEEAAGKIAKESYAKLLPEGLESKDQFLFTVIEESTLEPVGFFWMAKKLNGVKPYAFIYDIELIPEKRGQGLGKLLMQAVENEVRKLGCVSIGLHVFGHNAAAVSLYEKSGFETTSRMMKKDLK